MKQFKRLTFEERKEIQKLISHGLSCNKIAKLICRGKNVVVVEVRRCGGLDKYNAVEAQKLSDERKVRQISSMGRRTHLYAEENLKKVQDLINAGNSFWMIHRELKLSYITLLMIYKKLNIKHTNAYSLIENIEDKLYALEQQILILFDLVKENRGRENDKL